MHEVKLNTGKGLEVPTQIEAQSLKIPQSSNHEYINVQVRENLDAEIDWPVDSN